MCVFFSFIFCLHFILLTTLGYTSHCLFWQTRRISDFVSEFFDAEFRAFAASFLFLPSAVLCDKAKFGDKFMHNAKKYMYYELYIYISGIVLQTPGEYIP